MTKTCPIFSEYNGYWYFYEDIGELVPKWLSPEEAEKPEEGIQQTDVISEQSKGQTFNELYVKINGHLEQAYTLNQQLQNFKWHPIEYLSWTSQDEKGNLHTTHIEDMLPSKEALQLLLMQNDRCNALAVKLSLENPYKKPADQNSKHLTMATWYTWFTMNQQLEVEIGKVQDLANNVQLDTSKRFADIDIDRELNIPGVYVGEIQATHADYTAQLNYIMQHLESARVLASEIRHLEIIPSALNVP